MAHHGKIDVICARLRALNAAGTLPAGAARQAEALLKRLETPVRIAFVGPPDGRRAEIINAILGRPVVPDMRGRPTLELRYGAQERSRATLASGEAREIADLSQGIGPDVLFLSLTRTEPLLKRTCFLDVVTDGSPGELAMALKWASGRADVFVWCSRYFTGAERRAWRAVEERFTDHAFLAVWGPENALRSILLKDELAGEFLDVIAVELDGPSAAKDPGLVRLADGLGRHAELGRQADSDSALLFLKKFGDAAEAPQTPADGAAASSPPEPAAAEPAAPQLPGPEPDAEPAAAEPALADHAATLCAEAAALVRERARGLLAAVRSEAPVRATEIIGHCRETIEHLSEMLDSRAGDAAAVVAELSDRLMEAEELLVLLEIEGEGSPEIDGVCLMLQIRREFEARAAA